MTADMSSTCEALLREGVRDRIVRLAMEDRREGVLVFKMSNYIN